MVTKEIVKLRNGNDADALLIMTWRSNPLVYQGFLKQTKPLQYEGHMTYWRNQKNWHHWIIIYGEGEYERPVGQVNVQNLNTDCPEIGYFIGEIPLWGRGIATKAVFLAIAELKLMGYKQVCADVKDDNIASIKLLKYLGFSEGKGRDGLRGFKKNI